MCRRTMHRLFFNLPCVLALRHQPEFWTHGPIGAVVKGLYRDSPDVSTDALYLEMPLDHLSPLDETWQYKYFIVDNYFQEGGALVINMPGEGATGGCRASSMVKSLGAVSVCSEHRFFGTSVPRNSSTVEELRYLSVEQNLADQVALIKHIRSVYPSISKVVSNGGSYPGSSSAWIRDQFPEVVDASIAESPPLEVRRDFSKYDTSNLVALSSPDARCANTLARVNEAITRQMETNRSALFTLFKAVGQITSDLGDSDFIYGIGDVTAFVVQYGNKVNLCNALSPFFHTGRVPLPASARMTSMHRYEFSDVEYTQAFASITHGLMGEEYFSECAYNSTCMRDALFDVPAQSMRSWFWLTCTQLGWFQVAPQKGLGTRPRPYNMEKAMEQCAYIYPGAKLISRQSVRHFNKKYGGSTVNGRSKIFELDYSDDPWAITSSTSVVQRRQWSLNVDQAFTYLTCDGCGHCGSGVPDDKKQALLEQKLYFLQKWGIPVIGNHNDTPTTPPPPPPTPPTPAPPPGPVATGAAVSTATVVTTTQPPVAQSVAVV